MSVYVPGTQEKDPAKVIMSIQAISAEVDTNTANIANNTASIATNTAAIAALQANPSGISYSFVNKFINGTMDVWQFGTSALAAGATTVDKYANDGWIINAAYSAGSGPVMSQVANNRTGARTQWALKILGATNCTNAKLKQRIEGAATADFGTQTITFQARVYNSTGGSITPTLTVKYPTATDNYAATTTDGTVNAVNLQACPDSTWTQVAYTFTPSGTVALGMEVTIDFGNNFSANTKYVNVTECDIRATPSVSLGLNASPPLAELRPVSVEQPICQRYAFVIFPGAAAVEAALGALGSATDGYYFVKFPVPMFKAATASLSSPSDWLNNPYVSGATTQTGITESWGTGSTFQIRVKLVSASTGATSGSVASLYSANVSSRITVLAQL